MSNKDNNSDIGLETNSAAPTLSPERRSREAAQLARVAAQLNADAGVVAPTHVAVAPALPPAAYERPRLSPVPVVVGAVDRLVAEALAPKLPQSTHTISSGAVSVLNPARIFYTGRLKAGKDFVAAQTGATVVGFADPLYAIRSHFFGDVDKDRHGAREFLQIVGQWGRGEISDKYPLTPARAAFTSMVRALGPRGEFGEFTVEWDRFGRDADIWLNSLLRRVEKTPGTRVAITNVRFGNERTALKEAGWSGFHVMCSPQTLEQRIRAAGIPPNSAALTDASEQLAISLDAQALAVRDASRKVRVIWNDGATGCPTAAFHTVASYLELFNHE